ncbi:hypothetical protein B296_00007432 [Ensete ventricosum]|uniref:HHO5-like N-terminal domain-containing protein n=1 Tax=Ensete ventricosum TaxID=4639 RepID=A0A427B3S6_ENSVE|nr:hypothetical protein B296_00007432 [Ensete ventricosum]
MDAESHRGNIRSRPHLFLFLRSATSNLTPPSIGGNRNFLRDAPTVISLLTASFLPCIPSLLFLEQPSEYSHIACFKHCQTQAHAFTAVMDLLGRAQRGHDCIRALEEELKKIEAFQRELPLCLHLVNLSFAASRFPSGLFR